MKLLYCLIFLGDATEIDKFSKRLVKVTSTHTSECKELLKLMGVPYIEVSFMFYILSICHTYFTYFLLLLLPWFQPLKDHTAENMNFFFIMYLILLVEMCKKKKKKLTTAMCF